MKHRSLLLALVAVVFMLLVALAALVLRRSRAVPQPRLAQGGGPRAAARPRDLEWDGPGACYPKEMVDAGLKFVRGMVRSSRRFGPESGEDRKKLAAEAGRLSRAYGVTVSGDQLAAMRTMEVALEAQSGGARALRHAPEMLAASRGGEPVLAIAGRLRLPPVAVLRQILLEEGNGAPAVRAMLADPAQMPPRLAREAAAVFEADLGSRLNADRIRARSQAYEDALGEHLRGLGLSFQTEEDLRRAGASRHAGASLLTPDYLLRGPARINGREVNWIDAKDYPMYGSRLVAQSLAKQAAKYTKAFGPGAMIFSGGLMCDARVLPKSEGVPPLLLDGSHVAAPGVRSLRGALA